MSWLRLHGATRDPEIAEGLAADTADPLWALARQWQFGEFHGEDAASPVLVTADVVSSPITAFASSGGDVARRADRPLEVLVEQEPPDDDRLPLEVGWLLLRALAAAGVPDDARARLRSRSPATLARDDGLDPVGRAQLELLARRSLDGEALAADLASSTDAVAALVADLGVTGDLRARVARVVEQWLDTVRDLVRLPDAAGSSSWRSRPLEYQFQVGAPTAQGELTFAAEEYRGGTLDWYHLRRSPAADPLGAQGAPRERHVTVLPTPLRFLGMPAARFWEIEDGVVSFGDLAAGPEDLVRAVVGGFAATYGDDWCGFPLVVPAGSVSRVQQVVVHDDFGGRNVIPATAVIDGPDRVWRFFELEGDDGPDAPERADRRAPLLLVAPALPDAESGPAWERVDLVRDDAANLVWAVERRAPASSGRSVDRDALARRAAEEDAQDGSGQDWTYEAFRPVPENWIPFVPVRRGAADSATAQVYLRRARMAATDPSVPPGRLVPMGRILDARRPLRIDEEAIPDAGLRIDRRYQRARGADGSVHLWMGRRVRTGAGPARSGFATDRLLRPEPP
ncbi:hypothetical protein [Cellulomonas sp. P5_C5]